MTTDPITDMFNRLKNAAKNRSNEVVLPSSKFKLAILKILKQCNFITDYKTTEKKEKATITIILKYQDDKPAINKIKRISKPSLRVYAKYRDIPNPLQGLGLVIVSTPQGVIDGKQAKRKKIGGEIICEVI